MKAYSPNWSVVSIVGPDAVAFVQNLCTNDIKKLTEGEACEAFFLDVKAHIQAHAIVCRATDGCQIVVTSPRAPELASHLDRYHIREKLTIAVDETTRPQLLFDSGAEGFPLPGLAARLTLVASPVADSKAMTDEEFAAYRLEHAFPIDMVDIDDRRLPQEVNRNPLAISFTKGCYLGQEPVARIDALGHVNWLLVKLRLEGENSLTPGAPLTFDDKQVGEATSIAWSPTENATLLLGYVRREHAAAGNELITPAGAATVLPNADA